VLWYKGWLETRIRVAISLGWMALLLYSLHIVALKPPPPGMKPAGGLVVLANTFAVVIYAMLAGAGVNTQSAFQATRGLHGSTLFTLSLPVSRFRLLIVRAGLGWLEMAALIAMFCLGSWFLFPRGGTVAPIELAEHAGTLVVCFSGLYCFAVLLATFLSDSWRIGGSLLAFTALWLLSDYAHLPAALDIYGAMQNGSPLVAHTMPWSAMAFSLGLAVLLFFAAVKTVERREY
jgi:ABC-2 type transport system permease protein